MAKGLKVTSPSSLKAGLAQIVKPSKDLVGSITKKLQAQKLKTKSALVPTLKTSSASKQVETAQKNIAKLNKSIASKSAAIAKNATRPQLRLK